MYVRIARFENADGNWEERIEEVRKRMSGEVDSPCSKAGDDARRPGERSRRGGDLLREPGRSAPHRPGHEPDEPATRCRHAIVCRDIRGGGRRGAFLASSSGHVSSPARGVSTRLRTSTGRRTTRAGTGSGKTVCAKRLEADGCVRLSIDELVQARHRRYDIDYPPHAYARFHDEAVTEVDRRLVELLEAGQSVVLDHGRWERRNLARHRGPNGI